MMLKITSKKSERLCSLKLKKQKHQSTHDFLNENFFKILPCFYKMNTQAINQTTVESKGVLEKSTIIINPVKFTVDFKDQFANINIVK